MRVAIVLLMALTLAGCEGEVEKAVRYHLRDPDSAKFRDVHSCGPSDSVVRGQVNGKNAFGAYDGFRDFYYADGAVEFPDDPNSAVGLVERCIAALEASTAAMEKAAETKDNPSQ